MLAFLRGQKTSGMTRVKHAWAELRYHWYVLLGSSAHPPYPVEMWQFVIVLVLVTDSTRRLRILLYYPRLRRSSGPASEALVYLLRSASNIIHIHSELAHMGKLDPSWPQLKRIITCGQVLIICCARGEIHALESAGVFSRLIDLLEGHMTLWPSAGEAVTGFKRAAKALGRSPLVLH